MTSTTSIPRSGLSEVAFRKYESVLKQSCKDYPSVFKLTIPDGLSTLTLVARLRDAIKSYKDFNWPLTWDGSNISRLSVHNTNDGVFISGAKRLDTHRAQAIKVDAIAGHTNPKVLHLNLMELEAFCLLVSARHLKGPVAFTLNPGINPFNLEALFDVAIVQDNENIYILT